MEAAGLAAGAALGVAFDHLFKSVIKATKKVVSFKSSINNLNTTLIPLQSIFKDIERLNRVLSRPQEETDMFVHHLKQGEKLVRKCLKIKPWNVVMIHIYEKKLDQLKRKLDEFFLVVVQADLCRESKMISVGVGENSEKLDVIMSGMNSCVVSSNGFEGCCNVPGSNDSLVGLDVPIEEVKGMLMKNNEQVVVISAPGGCGKTTLVKEVCNDAEIRACYEDNIFFVIVSSSPNLILIVQRVFQSKKFRVPDFHSEEDAMNQLQNLFSTLGGPVLLVLDDVWKGSESLVERFIMPIPGYKVLVTSRFQFPRFDCTYKLKLLNECDSMTLFRYSAFKYGTCYVQDDIVEKVVKSCGGFPVALKVVGGSLRNQPEVVWIRSIQKWASSEAFFPTNSDVLARLQPSIDALDGDLMECFLDLASFPEDEKIPATALRDMWVELYEQDEDGKDTVYHLHELSTGNLVDLSLAREGADDVIDNCNGHFATQHDLLRELAIYLSNQETIDQRSRLIVEVKKNDFPKWWTEGKQQPVRARILSISTDDTFSSTWPDLQLPAVEVLILNLSTRTYSIPHFIETMRNLKVMVITNNGFWAAKLSNFTCLHHLVELKRVRLEYVSFPFVYGWLLQLRNLRKISLVTCEIGKAFEERTHQKISNFWPNLEEINIDYCHDLVELPLALFDLIHLKKLSITYCQELVELPVAIGKLTNLEVLRFHSCGRLSGLPESIGNLRKLRVLDISDCVGIDHLPPSIGDLSALRMINMRGCGEFCEPPYEVANLVQLEHVMCSQEIAIFWESSLSNLKVSVSKEDISLRWLHKI